MKTYIILRFLVWALCLIGYPVFAYLITGDSVYAVFMLGVGALLLALFSPLFITSSSYPKVDKVVGLSAFVLAIFLISTVFITTENIKTDYKTGYTIQQGGTIRVIGNDTTFVNNFAIVTINEGSDILAEKVIGIGAGEWLLEISDTSKFYIQKEIDKGWYGDRVYVSFIYDGKSIPDLSNKQFKPQD